MKVRYTETALADLDDLLSYLIERNPRAATTIGKAVEVTIDRVAAFPFSAEATDEPGVRMTPAGRFPYLIFYRAADDEVSILRVLHGARLRPGESER